MLLYVFSSNQNIFGYVWQGILFNYKYIFSNAIAVSIIYGIDIVIEKHDGDSDSTGSIAGNIIGAILGEELIPSYYLDNLELKDVITEIADDLATPIPVSKYSDNNDEYWLSKYSYCQRDTTKR